MQTFSLSTPFASERQPKSGVLSGFNLHGRCFYDQPIATYPFRDTKVLHCGFSNQLLPSVATG